MEPRRTYTPVPEPGTIILDREFEHSNYSLVCGSCQHFQGWAGDGERQTCKAFPAGIPWDIWDGKDDHRKPVHGDGGTTFQPRVVDSPRDPDILV
jgi:hypothetical protein